MILVAAVAAQLAGSPAAPLIVRDTAGAGNGIAASVAVPPGYATVYISGVLAPVDKLSASTEVQADAVLDRIEAQLRAKSLGLGDVVKLTVFLAAPVNAPRMDFAGWQAAYARRFGTAAQPNRPARSTVQVAALALPGALVEVEAIAAAQAR